LVERYVETGYVARFVNGILPVPSPLTVSDVLAAAGAPKGAENDKGTWLQGLEVLLASLRDEGNLTTLGSLLSKQLIVDHIKERFNVLRANPQRKRTKRPAVVITGLPRTGSTFLHHLLSTDKKGFRGPKHFEYMSPTLNPWLAWAKAQFGLRFMIFLFHSEFLAAHEIGPDDPEEDVTVHAQVMASVMWEQVLPVPAYGRWLATQNASSPSASIPLYLEAQDHLSQLLWVLESQEVKASGADDPWWVLKTPNHFFMMRELLDVFTSQGQDLVIVNTHRPPVKFMSSIFSLNALMWCTPMAGANVDFPGMLHSLEYLFTTFVKKALEFRNWASNTKLPSNVHIVDVDFERLTKTPLAVVEEIYTATGRTLGHEARRNIESWVAEHEVHRRNTLRHSHKLEAWTEPLGGDAAVRALYARLMGQDKSSEGGRIWSDYVQQFINTKKV
jgi:hypothetical protein